MPLSHNSSGRYPARLKNCTARSCFSAASRLEKVPRFLCFPVRESFLREYNRYSPDFSFRIIAAPLPVRLGELAGRFEGWGSARLFLGDVILAGEGADARLQLGCVRFALHLLEKVDVIHGCFRQQIDVRIRCSRYAQALSA